MPERFIGEISISREYFGHTEASAGIGDGIHITSFANSTRRKKGEHVSMEDLSGGLLRIAEAAKLLGVSPGTIRRWTNNGQLFAYRIGRRGDRRFKQEDILRFLEHTDEPPNGADAQEILT